MSSSPKVSVIVPTKNSAVFLAACLKSVVKQTYPNVEIIVVDNYSTDNTKEIAHKYTANVHNKGPERSAQRNYGVSLATGEYVLVIDSDMELTNGVVAACVAKYKMGKNTRAVIVPERSFGVGFWAQCKRLEKSFYVGIDWIEAARFFARADYQAVGGYNPALISGEDWDLSRRIGKLGSTARITEFINHNEGKVSLLQTVKKKAFYASKISAYVDANSDSISTASEIAGVFKRFALYMSKPVTLFKRPHIGVGMLVMKLGEYSYGALGYMRK